jgi:hypothetical protein
MPVEKIKKDGYKALLNWDIQWSLLQVRDILPGLGRPPKDPEAMKSYKEKKKSKKTGFPIDIESCMSIIDMSQKEEWKNLASMVALRIDTIYKAYKDAGLIDRS